MGTSVTAERAARVSPNSTVTIGLVILLLSAVATGAAIYGRQAQRLDSIETEVRELRIETREIRTLLLRQQSAGR